LNLDGFDHYAQVPHSPTMHLLADFTMEVWGRSSSGEMQALLSKWAAPGQPEKKAFRLMIVNSTTVRLELNVKGADVWQLDAPITPSPAWIHLAAVRKGDQVSIYQDGELKAAEPLEGSVANDSVPLYVGAGCDEIDQEPHYLFQGYLDEIRISPFARYQGASFEPEPFLGLDLDGVIAYWGMNDTDGVLTDGSGNGLDGGFVNGMPDYSMEAAAEACPH